MRGWRLVFAAMTAGILVWLMRPADAPPPAHQPPGAVREPLTLGEAFDPSQTGTLAGRVAWVGAIPQVQPLEIPKLAGLPSDRESTANPNAPEIAGDALAGAIVSLRDVDLSRSRAWDLPPVVVEATHPTLLVRQGTHTGRVGLVQRGTEVELVAREPRIHSIRGRAAAFFTLMLPDPTRPARRRLSESGVVELSSGSGLYWMRAYLFVSEHPYVTVTGPNGQFRLDHVPAGKYELVCWHANWELDRLERDPELVVPVRMYYHPPIERVQTVTVAAGGTAEATFSLSTADFAPAR